MYVHMFISQVLCTFIVLSLSPPSSLPPSLSLIPFITFQGSRLPSVGDADDYPEHGDGEFLDEKVRDVDDSVMYEVPGAHSGKKSRHLGTLSIHILFTCGCHNTVQRVLIVSVY